MNLSEYRGAIEFQRTAEAEWDGKGDDGATVALGVLAHQLTTALWTPGLREDALDLAALARHYQDERRQHRSSGSPGQ